MKLKAQDYQWTIQYHNSGASSFLIHQKKTLVFEGYRFFDGEWQINYNILPTQVNIEHIHDNNDICPLLGPLNRLGDIFEWKKICPEQALLLHTYYDEDIYSSVPACTIDGITFAYLSSEDSFTFYLTESSYQSFTIQHMGYLETLKQCHFFFSFMEHRINKYNHSCDCSIATSLTRLLNSSMQQSIAYIDSLQELELLLQNTAQVYSTETTLFLS